MLKPFKRAPVLIALSVSGLVCAVACLRLDLVERLERLSYDVRVRAASRCSPQTSTNFGFLFIDEQSVRSVWDGSLGYRFGLYWPRQVYGRVVDELRAEGARAVAFDILFGELRPDHPPVQMADGTNYVESDEFFARQMRLASNVIIAVTPEVSPPDLLATNALALGDIATDKDSEGVLRRVKAFRLHRAWHPAFRQMEADPQFGVDLAKARVEPRQVVLPRLGLEPIQIPLDQDGNFQLADFWGEKLPAGMARVARPFAERRVWHMGVVLAAVQLGLDLEKAQIDLHHGRILLRGRGGVERVLPVDSEGFFYVDWAMSENHPRLTTEPIQDVLGRNRRRLEGEPSRANPWAGKLVVVGSSAVIGNNLTDRGATPLSPDTLLVSKHWNVANSILLGRFVRRAPLSIELVLIAGLGLASALLTWRLRVLLASVSVAALMAAYLVLSMLVYIESRLWLPVVLPVAGACLMVHVSLVTWRVVFEQAEQRRVKTIFSTVVSPKIVKELLQAPSLALGGARREVTVLFADIRGFTELTDRNQERAAAFVRSERLSGEAAEACFDEQARETLSTVNLYLGRVAEIVIQQDGTLDKFIGDCVMAFWGAPTPNPAHAASCVRAAIQVQRAIYELNQERARENAGREQQNVSRVKQGLSPLPLQPLLSLGTGINSGMVTVGLMGSAAHSVVRSGSYTVFGREVNLASRLEVMSGHSRIVISQSTFEQLRRQEPALAATCHKLPPANVKGFREALEVYEVPWATGSMHPQQPGLGFRNPSPFPGEL